MPQKYVDAKTQPKPNSKTKPGRPKKDSVQTKLCVRCGKPFPLEDFYRNRGWNTQSFRDAWCKKCADDFCIDKTTLREYCWYNNRVFVEDAYNRARDKAIYIVANDPDYVDPDTSETKKNAIFERAVCRQYRTTMNLDCYYTYTDNISTDGVYRDFNENSTNGTITEKVSTGDDGEQVYSDKWHGEYLRRDLQYQEKYYSDLERSYAQDTKSSQDYAMKVAKASLLVDEMQRRFAKNTASSKELNDAINQFDRLSRSANFAECARKAGETTGTGSLGEQILSIEQTGILNTRKVVWPQDHVDELRNDLRHIQVAVGESDE